MNADSHSIDVDGRTVREGTAIYDSAHDRVLWISEIDDYELAVEVADAYADDDPIWWAPDSDDPTRVADGSRIAIDRFRRRVQEGRFEVGPQPPDPHPE